MLPVMQVHDFRSASHRIAAESRSTLEPSPKRLDRLLPPEESKIGTAVHDVKSVHVTAARSRRRSNQKPDG